jgi:hypothetical protein
MLILFRLQQYHMAHSSCSPKTGKKYDSKQLIYSGDYTAKVPRTLLQGYQR